MPVEQPFIRCMTCKRMSFNLRDIQHRYCAACNRYHDRPGSFELGISQRELTGADKEVMADACKTYLTPEELVTVGQAIDACNDEVVAELMKHGGREVSPPEWAALVLSICSKALAKQGEPQ